MTTKSKRPTFVWLTQIFLAILSIFPGWLIFLGLGELLDEDLTPAGPAMWLVLAVVLVTPISVGFLGLALRKAWGRWVSLVFLLLFALLCVAWVFNTFERLDMMPILVVQVLFFTSLSLAYGLAVGKSVSDFFAPESNREPSKPND